MELDLPWRVRRLGHGAGVAGEVARGDVRLVRFPPPDKQRPVLVLTRTSALRYLNRVTVVPITSTIRDIPTEVVLAESDGLSAPCAANVDHVVSIPKAALGRRVTGLGPERMREICRALGFALGCEKAVVEQ